MPDCNTCSTSLHHVQVSYLALKLSMGCQNESKADAGCSDRLKRVQTQPSQSSAATSYDIALYSNKTAANAQDSAGFTGDDTTMTSTHLSWMSKLESMACATEYNLESLTFGPRFLSLQSQQ